MSASTAAVAAPAPGVARPASAQPGVQSGVVAQPARLVTRTHPDRARRRAAEKVAAAERTVDAREARRDRWLKSPSAQARIRASERAAAEKEAAAAAKKAERAAGRKAKKQASASATVVGGGSGGGGAAALIASPAAKQLDDDIAASSFQDWQAYKERKTAPRSARKTPRGDSEADVVAPVQRAMKRAKRAVL